MKASVTVAAGLALATTSLASGQVVFDQIGADDGSNLLGALIPANQYFEPAFSAYNIAAIDDFTLGSAVTITSVEAVIGGFGGYQGLALITGYQVNIYSSSAAAGVSLVGDVFSQDFVLYSSTFSYPLALQDNVQFDVSIALAAGTYFVAVIPSNEFGVNGQTGIIDTNLLDGVAGAFQANPNGGFGFGALQGVNANLGYRLSIPAPGALAVFAVGLIGFRRRRR